MSSLCSDREHRRVGGWTHGASAREKLEQPGHLVRRRDAEPVASRCPIIDRSSGRVFELLRA